MQELNIYGPYFTAAELGINDQTSDDIRSKMYLLVKFGLNYIRKKYGPTKVDSGYRTPEHNLIVGGVTDSQHCTGEAVDIVCLNVPSTRVVFEDLRLWWPGQLRFYPKKGHLHIALPTIKLQVEGRLVATIANE